MGKQVNQGTRWESRIVNRVKTDVRFAMRLPKTGVRHEPDLFIKGKKMRPLVAWENWVGRKGDGRRRAVRMVTMTEDHFYELVELDKLAEYGYYVQAKSTQSLGLRATLEGLSDWMNDGNRIPD